MDLNFEMKQGLSELASLKDATNIVQYQASDLYDLESLISLCSFKLIIALRSTETHNIALKNVTLFRSEIWASCKIFWITIVTANTIEFSIRLKNW